MNSKAVRRAAPSGLDRRNDAERPPVRLPIPLAAIGLVAVLLVLTVFSVTVAVTNSRGTERARDASAASDLYEKASGALAAQEEGAEEVVADVGDEEARGDYAASDLATHEALRALSQVAQNRNGPGELEGFLDLHDLYGAAVTQMFIVAEGGPEAAEAFEDSFVDVHFDPLTADLDHHVSSRNKEARTALASIGQAQRFLRIATPTLFTGGLIVLAMFITMLGRSRRTVFVQADENRHQSLHDSLTGLPNRALLHRQGHASLELSKATGTPAALMLLDLDRFKEINDTLGHHHGDLVLQAVGGRLSGAVRSSDMVVRLGGDEFAILLPQIVDEAAAVEVASKVQQAMATSVDVGGILLDVGISIGVAVSGVHGDDISTLLQHADIAMYYAKERDLGVCVYDEALNEHSRDQLGLLGELRRAIENEELVLHFQPKVAIRTGAFAGAEALLRWDHPTRGLVPPGLFIPAAERTALIRPLTAWVLNAALAECRRWADDGRVLKLAVNVSARNLLDDSFGDEVVTLLAKWQLPPNCLLLEVTESAIVVDPVRAKAVLSRFSKLGIDVAIDDFGAGYTSIAHLRDLPVQELKLDQTLVQQMATSAADTLIIRAVIGLAHSLGLRTVAEGVEDAETLERLSVLGCDTAQGYYLARPMPAADLREWTPASLKAPRLDAVVPAVSATAGDVFALERDEEERLVLVAHRAVQANLAAGGVARVDPERLLEQLTTRAHRLRPSSCPGPRGTPVKRLTGPGAVHGVGDPSRALRGIGDGGGDGDVPEPPGYAGRDLGAIGVGLQCPVLVGVTGGRTHSRHRNAEVHADSRN